MAWKNVKVQKKFAIGFGSIILMMIGTSLVSLVLMQQIVDDAAQVIDGNRLKSEIIQREVDHLNWESALSLYVNDSTGEAPPVQTDSALCLFGKWLDSQNRIEAEKLVPQLTPLLRETEKHHAVLHESAHKIEEYHTIIDRELGNFFREKKMDHIAWKLNLLNYISDEKMTVNPVQMDPDSCSLGIWLNSSDTTSLYRQYGELEPIISELKSVHEKVHRGARVIDNEIQNGRRDEAMEFFHGELDIGFTTTMELIDQLISWHDRQMSKRNLSREIFATETHGALIQVQSYMHQMIETVSENIMTEDAMLETATRGSGQLLTIITLIVFVAVASAIILSRSLLRPIIKCVGFADSVAMGDLDAALDIDQKDQIGDLADSLRRVLQGFREKADVVGRFANGDLTGQVVTLSEKDGLGISLQTMKRDLNELIGQVVSAVDQISSGAEQIAEASQNLSEGAATQASSTEEVSVMVNEISGQAAQNADNASQARSISEKASLDAEKGNESMRGVVSLMEKINSGADETKKIVKVIDDIAFQINLLALNANVEAARAGKYGKGFAVVADEVRNLAVKSAQAARETSEMVEESIRNIQNGYQAVQKSADQLREIVSGSRQVSEILEEIAAASRNQDDGISQATSGLGQIDKITQENTGNAEETASASEELSSQSLQLKGLVDRFKLERDERGESLVGSPVRQLSGRSRYSGRRDEGQNPRTKPERETFRTVRGDSLSTGIKPVNPSEVISLDDSDFDQF